MTLSNIEGPISTSGLNRNPQNITYIPPVTILRRPLRGVGPTGRRLDLELFFYF